MREVLTPKQVAVSLQLAPQTVYRLIRARRLAATKVGRRYHIPREELDAFLLANCKRPEVHAALFARFMALAERNTGLDSDDVLEELEQEDEARKRQAASV